MARTSTYLNFQGQTEAAFNFYKAAFGTEFEGIIQYMRDMPSAPGMPPLSAEDGGKVLNIVLPIVGGHRLMGTDSLESMGQRVTFGNNISLNLEPDTRAETQRLFDALAVGGKVDMPLQDMFWGAYFGSLTDQYGVQWMFNCAEPI
jgi:PhnB protein